MVILYPLRVVLTNWPINRIEMCKVPNIPKEKKYGYHDVPLTGVVYIEQSDFKIENKDPNYYGLEVGKEVHLKYAYNIKCTGYILDSNQAVKEIRAIVDFESKKLTVAELPTTKLVPKGKICWVAEQPHVTPLIIEVRLYSQLFKSAIPPKDYLNDVNPESLTIVKAYSDPYLSTAKACNYIYNS